MNKAFSSFTIKSFKEDEGIIEGFATTPKADRSGDIVVPSGAQFELPIPLLFNHDQDNPIGHVIAATVKDEGSMPFPVEIDFSTNMICGGTTARH